MPEHPFHQVARFLELLAGTIEAESKRHVEALRERARLLESAERLRQQKESEDAT